MVREAENPELARCFLLQVEVMKGDRRVALDRPLRSDLADLEGAGAIAATARSAS